MIVLTEKAKSAAKIRALNDSFRRSLIGGRVMLTSGVSELPPDLQGAVLRKVCAFDSFEHDYDPHLEHDFGSVDLDSNKFFWKIDCYDETCEYGSEDPTDTSKTTRVLTIMLADEY